MSEAITSSPQDFQTRLSYIERDVRDINDKQSKFSATFEVQMQRIEDLMRRKDQENEIKFVRSDNIKLVLDNINENLSRLTAMIDRTDKRADSFEKYEGMLQDIKKERDAIKFKIMGYIQQGVFYAVCAGFLLGLFDKLKP